MADFEVVGMEVLINKIEEMGRKGSALANEAAKAGAEIIGDGIKEEAPVSDSPRRATTGSQSWRTGEHAANNIKTSKVVKGAVKVGILAEDNKAYFYMKHQNWGTSKMPNPKHKDFMGRAIRKKKPQAIAAMKEVFKRGLNL